MPEWVKIDGEAKLDEFAQLLQRQVLSGYRRYEVVGAGLGPQQAGMWVANLRGDATVEQFVETYNKFWKPGSDTLYMETLRATRGYPTPK